MAQAPDRPDAVPAGFPAFSTGSVGRMATTAQWTLFVSLLLGWPAFANAEGSSSALSPRISAANDLAQGVLLVEYYEQYLRDHDSERFGLNVSARYTEAALASLVEAADVSTRRASVLALGMVGTFQCNAGLARGLRDVDDVVRELAKQGLWAVWFRADSPEHNATLEQVRALIDRRQLGPAIDLASQLIAAAPRFAEAYNQRAIAHFFRGEFAESAEDCQRVLEHNPYHIGALGGLAQCQLRLDRPRDALQTLRRAAKLQPRDESLRETISLLEAASAE